MLDSARRDAFEPYGAPPGSSPTVAQIAARGTALSDVFATASWTVPSHASLFTGLLPRAAGLQGAPGMDLTDPAPALGAQADRLLAEVMRRAGYRTAAVSTNLWVSEASGFGTGFDEFVSIDSHRQTTLDAGSAGDRLRLAFEAARARGDDGAAEAGRVLRRWIDSASPDRPCFWFVNLIECHSPYLPPRPYNDIGPIGRVRAAAEARRYLNLGAIWRASSGRLGLPAPALKRMRRLYAGALRYQDAWLAEALEALERRSMLEDTVVVVTSDHGENLGEDGLIAHALSLDDRLIRVPFVLAGPGAREAAPIRSLAELPRLIAELTGLDPHPWPADALPRDAAVAQLDPPVDPTDPRALPTLAEWGLGEEALERLTSQQTCATDGRWKLLRRGGEELLFDTENDPLELAPNPLSNGAVSAAAEAPLATLRRALAHPATRAHEPPEAVGPRPEASADELRDLEQRMRTLGYL